MCHQPATLEEAVGLMEAFAWAEMGSYRIPEVWKGQADHKDKQSKVPIRVENNKGRQSKVLHSEVVKVWESLPGKEHEQRERERDGGNIG